MSRLLLVGAGNAMRRDDAVGLRIVRMLRPRLPPGVRIVESDGDFTRFISALADAELVVVVDAMAAGAAPGTLTRVSEAALAQAGSAMCTSTHGIGVAAMVEMLKVLSVSPVVQVYGVQGADFGWGEGLSAEIALRLENIADEIYSDVVACLAGICADH